MTNCINCGAVLSSHKCEYCGTIYSNNDSQNRIDILRVKNSCLENAVAIQELYASAIAAMRRYGG